MSIIFILEKLKVKSVLCIQNDNNRIRVPYNCIELIFGMVHPSTFERLKTQFVFISSSNVSTLGVFFRRHCHCHSVTEEDPQGQNV